MVSKLSSSFLLIGICASLLIKVEANSQDDEWSDYKETYGKSYTSALEDSLRQKIFEENSKQVEVHHENYNKGLVSYDLKVNAFSDLSVDEVDARIQDVKNPSVAPKSDFEAPTNRLLFKSVFLPKKVDWTSYDSPVVNNPVSWASVAVDAIEDHFNIHKSRKVSLSKQQLIDCLPPFFGRVENAFDYIIKNGWINTREVYPDTVQRSSCAYNGFKDKLSIAGWVALPIGNEYELKKTLAEKGPVAAHIDARDKNFSQINCGIYVNEDCSNDIEDLNLAVLIVGYGEENGFPYWLLKASFGTCWGEAGYIKLARDYNNHCGIATAASYPLL